MLERGSSNQVGITPSSMANSKFVSHWMASWSWGMASKIVGQLVHHARLVERLDAGLVLGRDERGDGRERRGQRHLEPAVHRRSGRRACAGRTPVRGDGGLRVAEVVEAERSRGTRRRATRRRGRARCEIVPGRADLELGPRAEHRVLPHDPVGARPGLPVGHLHGGGRRARSPSPGRRPRHCASGTLPTSSTPPVAAPLLSSAITHHPLGRRVRRPRRPGRVSVECPARPSRGFASGERRV